MGGGLYMDELDKIDNKQLREKILGLNKEQLRIISHMAKNYFIMEYLDLEKLKKDNYLIKGLDKSHEKNRLIEIYDELLNSFINIVDGKSFDKEEILILREEIYNYADILSAYSTELVYIKNRLDSIVAKDRESSLEILPNLYKNRDRILEELEGEISSLENSPMDYTNFMATVVNILPFKLSKYKYYDLVREGLMTSLKNYSQDYAIYQIQEYKKQFNPRLNKGYGLFFDEYFTKIEKAARLNIDKMSINYMKEAIRNYNKLIDEIGYNMMNIRRIGILTNRLLTMGIISSEWKTNFNSDIVDNFKNKTQGVDDQVRKEFLLREKELFKLVEDFKLYNDEATKREDYDYNLDHEFEKSRQMLVYYNDLEFLPYNLLDPSSPRTSMDKVYLENMVANFLDFIARNNQSLDSKEARMRMKKLLTILTPPFKNKDSFMNYVSYSLDSRIISDKELNVAVISLNYIINKRKE